MAGYGIGKFISGMVQGGELRHRWQDRKRSQALEDEDRALAKEDRARRIALEDERMAAWRADRDYLSAERGYAQKERSRAEAERAEREALFADAEAAASQAANQSLGEALEAQAGAAPAPVEPPVAGPVPTPGYRMPRPQQAAPGAAPPVEDAPPAIAPAPPEAKPAKPTPRAPGTPGVAPSDLLVGDPSISPMASDLAQINESPMLAGRGIQRPAPVAVAAAAPAPLEARPNMPGAAAADDAPATPPRPTMPEPPPRGVSEAAKPAPAPGAAAASEPAAAAPRAPVPSAAPDSPVPPVTPSVETAVATARVIRPTTPAKARTYDEEFIEAYREEQVPKIVRYYLSKGDTASADSFQKWASDGATQQGMRAWGRAVASATVGDEDGFLDNLVEAYNTAGYYDDGLSVIRDRSGFIRGDEGSITGAFITYRDDATGEEGTQRFENISDLYRLGVNFLSPEAVFEQGMEMVKAADEAAAEAMEHERALELEAVKAGAKQKTTAQILDEEVESLRSNDLSGQFASLPIEEQIAKAVESLRAKQAALAGAGAGAFVAAPGE